MLSSLIPRSYGNASALSLGRRGARVRLRDADDPAGRALERASG